jgi:hypothetical protein
MTRTLALLTVLAFGSTAQAGWKDRNKKPCEDWCKRTPACEKCSTLPGCGGGLKQLRKFGGVGKNWYACEKNKWGARSDANQKACNDWCKGNNKCIKCSKLPGCGVGAKHLRTFGRRGKDWYACEKRKSFSEGSKDRANECAEWCRKRSNCHFCSNKPGCGDGFIKLESFRGRGKNKFACTRAGSINRIWWGFDSAERRHKVLMISLGGYYGYKKRDGFEWFCDDHFSGNKAVPVLKCISSFGSTTTRSAKLADNILALANKIKQKNGGTFPKIILIGKSMGGCKLHHAVFKRVLKSHKIDLFIGIDMSCSISCHAKAGAADALSFKNNIKKIYTFYQMADAYKRGGQCGHMVLRPQDRRVPNKNININVNEKGFDPRTERVTNKPLCPKMGHLKLDTCEPLRRTVKELVMKVVRSAR